VGKSIRGNGDEHAPQNEPKQVVFLFSDFHMGLSNIVAAVKLMQQELNAFMGHRFELSVFKISMNEASAEHRALHLRAAIIALSKASIVIVDPQELSVLASLVCPLGTRVIQMITTGSSVANSNAFPSLVVANMAAGMRFRTVQATSSHRLPHLNRAGSSEAETSMPPPAGHQELESVLVSLSHLKKVLVQAMLEVQREHDCQLSAESIQDYKCSAAPS
jgi:hypothetical protein